jgi:hypothetical protein
MGTLRTYRLTERRARRSEVVYVADIYGIEAESEAEARLNAEAILPRLPGVKDERWSDSEPETTLSPPEIIEMAEEVEFGTLARPGADGRHCTERGVRLT